jgi:uncharacterized protein (TIGR02996 family)
MRTFTFTDAKSHKFWNIERKGKSFTVTYGRIGSAGQAQTKTFADEARAIKEHDKLVTEKLRKGYRETTPAAKTVPASLRESLEAALVDNPDDLASHMAYADYLTEQGDPLGDLVRVQMLLEDGSRPADERKKLQQQERKLLKAHGRAWLGELAPYLLDQKPKKQRDYYEDLQVGYTFRRGWVDSLALLRYSVAFTRVLARSPQLRLLRRLVMVDNKFEEPHGYAPGDGIPDDCGYPQLYPLARCPYLGNVRVFQLGELLSPQEEAEADDGAISCQTEGEAAIGMIKQMPRVEELYLLAHDVDTEQLFSLKSLHHLRVLMVYHNTRYPLARLAKNPSLGNLTHLLCHPHALDDERAYIREPAVRALVNSPELRSLTHLRLRLSDMGDKGVKTIIDSGILKRLKELDLQHGCVTDRGAQLLAACPDVKTLQRLDLTDNALTAEGIAALRDTGVNLVADVANQWSRFGGVGAYDEYLFAGDIE